MRNTTRTSVSRDASLVALLATVPGYPGPAAMLDAADRAWLRARDIPVPDRAEPVPLHELARIARQKKASAEKNGRAKKNS